MGANASAQHQPTKLTVLVTNVQIRQYDNDVAIMDAIIDKQEEFRGTSSVLNARMVQNSNTVRLYLKCTFTSDLKNHATNKMHENLYAVTAPRTMSEVYAYQSATGRDVYGWISSVGTEICRSPLLKNQTSWK